MQLKEDVRRFQDGEIWHVGEFIRPAGEMIFDICPDGENPRSAVIAAIGRDFVLKLENLSALRICVGEKSFLHPALLMPRLYSRIAVATDGELISITVNGRNPLVITGAEYLTGEVILGVSEFLHRFRGWIGNCQCRGFSGNIAIPQLVEKNVTTVACDDLLPGEIDFAGKWEFLLLPAGFSSAAPLPDAKLFTAQMEIPGYWDDHVELICESDSFDRRAKINPRFRPLSFPMGQITPDATMPFLVGTGYYRKKFRFAPGSAPENVVLTIGPAVWGCTVFCNGKLAGSNPGYSTGTRCDLTELLDFDGVNTLIVAVSNFDRVFDSNTQENGQHIGLAVRGYQGMRGGIGGYCRLHIAGAGKIEDAYCRFDGSKLHCTAEITGSGSVTWELSDENGRILRTATGAAAAIDAADLPRWDDENPVLFTVTAVLAGADGRIHDRNSFRYGLRTLATAGARILLNDIPVYLRGTTEHHYFPETANAPFDKAKYLADIKLWRSLGFNFLRFHTWCPPEPYLDAADECGMICQIEVPPHVSADEWSRILKVLRRHVSAAIICGGNEEAFTDFRLNEVRELAGLTRKLMPGTLFNPQEALAKVEYRLLPDEPEVVTEPFIHNPRKLAELAEFSDVYGSYNWGYFSYIYTEFPGAEPVDARCRLYGKPLLSHEIGIMGGYLDFRNEKRYENTVVPPDIYVEARKLLERHGIFSRAGEFFRLNSAFNNDLRKYLFENIRSCRNISGFDFLGVNDAHWHRCGYPCGMTDEFGNLRPGVTPETVQDFNAQSVLLCDIQLCRAVAADSGFSRKISVSHFGKAPLPSGVLQWEFQAENFTAAGESATSAVACGSVVEIGKLELKLPPVTAPVRAGLQVKLAAGETVLSNKWEFWLFPVRTEMVLPPQCREVTALDDETIDFIAAGGRVLLTDNFPVDRTSERFQSDTTGRSLGHLGTVLRRHALVDDMKHDGYAGLQFAGLLAFAAAMDFTASQLPFNPVIEYIPSYKLVRRKTPLCEFSVGKGRLIMCGLRLDSSDPAAEYFHRKLYNYLGGEVFENAPAVDASLLKQLLRQEFADSGVAKTDEAWDPNVSAGKKQQNR